MWSQSCFTDVRHGGQHRRCNKRSRHSSTPEAHLQNSMAREDPKWRSAGANGTGTSGQADTAEEVGLDRTHPQEASKQHHTPSPDLAGTHRGREREVGLATVGGETLKQSWNSRGPTSPEWPEQPRTECDGRGSLLAYAPPWAMGICK